MAQFFDMSDIIRLIKMYTLFKKYFFGPNTFMQP